MRARDSTLLEVDGGGAPAARYLIVFAPAGTRVVDLPEGGALVVGRAPDVAITVDDRSVSRRHAEIAVLRGTVVVRDLGSRNGTFVGGVKIAATTPLESGGEVTVGSTVLRLASGAHATRQRTLIAEEFEARLSATLRRARTDERTVALVLLRSTSLIGRVAGALSSFGLVGDYGAGHYGVALPLGADDAARGIMAALVAAGVDGEVGAASFPRDATSVEALVARARVALRRADPRSTDGGSRYVAFDPAMKGVFALARKLAAGRIPVLVMGETGAGKEIVTEAIHRWSPRAAGPFVRVNCASLPESLLEAELFGYEKGAFTGAGQGKPGLFEAAAGGTLFLDEVGDLPPSQQAKLLRALEDGRVRRVGSVQDQKIDVRIVAATNRDLERASGAGEFRADLYFRLSGAVIAVPPLRSRPADVLPLARHFLAELGVGPRLASGTEQALMRYAWPGNVRELRNTIERAVLVCEADAIHPEHLPDRVRVAVETTSPGGYQAVKSEMRAVERTRILEALEACDGNQTHAADRLGMPRRTLVAKMTALAIPRRRGTRGPGGMPTPTPTPGGNAGQ